MYHTSSPAPIHHVMTAIPAGGEDTARRFYVDLLGLTEEPKPPTLGSRGGIWLATGSLSLHLGVDPAFAPATKAHIALVYDNLGDVRNALSAAGFEPGELEHELPGFVRCYVSDPFGNRIELMQPQ